MPNDSMMDSLEINSNEPVLIAGAARMGRQFLAALRARGVEPVAITDNNKLGDLDGVPILKPETARERFPSGTVLVASMLFEHELWKQATELGFERVIAASTLHHAAPDTFVCTALDGMWGEYADVPEIEWADAESKRVFDGVLTYRRTRDPAVYAGLRAKHAQYFPPGIISLDDSDTFCDCGAFTGDTLESLSEVFSDRSPKYFGFEPDPANYVRLLNTGARYRGSFQAINAGVGESESILSFHPNGTGDAHFTAEGELTVPVHRLDSFFNERTPPTMIKMDIEGMEPDALRGAEEIIRSGQPNLAICVYHKPDHLWTIPQLVRSLRPAARLYLRHYSNNLPETVLYAV